MRRGVEGPDDDESSESADDAWLEIEVPPVGRVDELGIRRSLRRMAEVG